MENSEIEITISDKQAQAFELLDDPQVMELCFGGGAGGGKSWLVCMWMAIQCAKYPGIRFGLGRFELKNLRSTTVETLISEVHPHLGIREGKDYVYKFQEGVITYKNGSKIFLRDLAPSHQDPDYARLGSTNLTHVIIEEVGEIFDKKAIEVFSSRANRYLNKRYGIVGKLILTTNPSYNVVRTEYYDPYDKLGGGDYQKWINGIVTLPSGNVTDAFRAYIRSLVTDNPFIDDNYIHKLDRLDEADKKRLRDGDWNYSDDKRAAFSNVFLNNALVDKYDLEEEYVDEEDGKTKTRPLPRSAGLDVADEGQDDSCITEYVGDVLVNIHKIKVDKSNPNTPIGHQVGQGFIDYCVQRGIPDSNTAMDGVGIGVSARDYMRSKKFYPAIYKAGAAPSDKKNPMGREFDNLRTETVWQFKTDIESGKLKIYRGIPLLQDLIKQLLAHRTTPDDNRIVLEPKKKLKDKMGGKSPDEADSAIIGWWKRNGGVSSPATNKKRIAFGWSDD